MPALTKSSSRKTSPKDMTIGLFVPCYIDMVYPEVGIATLELFGKVRAPCGLPTHSNLLRTADVQQRRPSECGGGGTPVR